MKYRHSTFIVLFVAASVVAGAILPYSVVSYIEACKSGFGARFTIDSAFLMEDSGVRVLDITWTYSSPQRLSTEPGDYWINVSANGVTVRLWGSIDHVIERGDSGTYENYTCLTNVLTEEEYSAFSSSSSVSVEYWIWVGVPDRGSGSPISGTTTVALEGP